MGLFKTLLNKYNKNERFVMTQLIKKLDGMQIKYVTERPDDENETVIGKAGAIIIKGEELLVYSNEKVLFRALITQLDASELFSLEGVILKANDLEHDGQFRQIIAYYTYYRKN